MAGIGLCVVGDPGVSSLVVSGGLELLEIELGAAAEVWFELLETVLGDGLGSMLAPDGFIGLSGR